MKQQGVKHKDLNKMYFQRISIGAIKDTLWSALTKRKAAGIKGFKLGNRGYIDMLWSGLTKRKPTSIKGFELGNT